MRRQAQSTRCEGCPIFARCRRVRLPSSCPLEPVQGGSRMKLRGLQHVSSPYPVGRREDVRRFYGEVLGLTEIPQPTTLTAPLVWYSAGDGLELHFFPGEVAAGSARHFCLDVHDLDRMRQ